MILILTQSDQTQPKTITPEFAEKYKLPADSTGKVVIELNERAKQAAAFAETVWHRDIDGTVRMIKSRTGVPQGTPVTLFAVAELFGIKVDRTEQADSAEKILQDIVNGIDRSQPLPPFWEMVIARAETLNIKKS